MSETKEKIKINNKNFILDDDNDNDMFFEEITINNFYNNIWFVYLIIAGFLLTLSIIHLNNNMNIKKDLLKPCEETIA